MRASKVFLLGLASAAAFAAGALAGPPRSLAIEANRTNVGAVIGEVTGPRRPVAVRKDLTILLEAEFADADVARQQLADVAAFVLSYTQGVNDGSIDEAERDDYVVGKPGLTLRMAGISETGLATALDLVNEWIDVSLAEGSTP